MVVGVLLFAAAVGYLTWRFWRADGRYGFPGHGVVGLLLLGAGAGGILGQIDVVTIFVTPIVWTGYILTIDAAIFRLKGRSLVKSAPPAFGWMALLSIPLWLVYEAYNLRLENWRYVGLPQNTALRGFGYLWSFATIWPAVLETAEFLRATQFRGGPGRPVALPARWLAVSGAILLLVPLLVPPAMGAYLFGLVWLGFAFLLDPLNYRARSPSILGDLERGDRARLWSLLLAGVICGFFWEFWNYWATAKWVYVFPMFQRAKIFEMPVPGYLGFPAFGVEVFAMYVYVARLLRVPYHEVG